MFFKFVWIYYLLTYYPTPNLCWVFFLISTIETSINILIFSPDISTLHPKILNQKHNDYRSICLKMLFYFNKQRLNIFFSYKFAILFIQIRELSFVLFIQNCSSNCSKIFCSPDQRVGGNIVATCWGVEDSGPGGQSPDRPTTGTQSEGANRLG